MIAQLEDKLELYLVDKAPAIPKDWKELLVKITPWFLLVTMLMALPLLLAALGLTAILAPFSFLGGASGAFQGAGISLTWVFTLIMVVIEAMAIPGLFKRAKSAWYLLFYATLIGAVQNIIAFNIGGLVIGTLLSLYILFQIKQYYK